MIRLSSTRADKYINIVMTFYARIKSKTLRVKHHHLESGISSKKYNENTLNANRVNKINIDDKFLNKNLKNLHLWLNLLKHNRVRSADATHNHVISNKNPAFLYRVLWLLYFLNLLNIFILEK